jgi:hypothetical protein
MLLSIILAMFKLLQIITLARINAATVLKCPPQNIQLVLVILPEKAEATRNAVKYVCDCVLGKSILAPSSLSHNLSGLRSQCIREDKAATAKSQYWNNIALK